LYGAWGAVDLEDCVTAVRSLVADGIVDPRSVLVRGASAGGYLTLQCLARSDVFLGGMCRCGIADVAKWREDAHDYESRYTDLIVGPRADDALYAERSPARHIGPRSGPVLLVHGLADTVVPPRHAQIAAAAYARAGRPHRLELLDGEPHSPRRFESRRRWLQAELEFYGGLLGERRPEQTTGPG
jgi:dipeptidyl aminopeptidase/acylaminoacyl peptidase